MPLVDVMSALRLNIHGAPRASAAHLDHHDVLDRVARMSVKDKHAARASDDFDDAHSSDGSDFRSELTSPDAFSPLGNSSVTSFDFDRNSDDLASDSDARSDTLSLSPAPSLYSLTESIRGQSLRMEHGRAVNTYSDIYRLAADETEAERLDKQHTLFKGFMGAYVEPMQEALADDDPLTPKACLDIGCGSGAWAIDVARDFPHVSCVAVDLVPMPAMMSIPPNLRFEIDDVNLGLEHFLGDFDVVHARLISTGIKDYYKLVEHAALALRPHGLADFTDCDFRVYDLEKRPILPSTREIWGLHTPPEGWTGTGMARVGSSSASSSPTSSRRAAPPSPYLARWFTLAGQAARKRGGNVDAAALLHRWISGHRAYEDVVYREFWLPCAPWMRQKEVRRHRDFRAMDSAQYEKHCWAGDVMRDDLLEFLRSARPLLLSTGVPEVLADELEAGAARELREARIPLYFRIQNVFARKRAAPPPPPRGPFGTVGAAYP